MHPVLWSADTKGFCKTSEFSIREFLLLFILLFLISLASNVVSAEFPMGHGGAVLKLDESDAGKPPVAVPNKLGMRKAAPECLTSGGQRDRWEMAKPQEGLPLPPCNTR